MFCKIFSSMPENIICLSQISLLTVAGLSDETGDSYFNNNQDRCIPCEIFEDHKNMAPRPQNVGKPGNCDRRGVKPENNGMFINECGAKSRILT